MKIILSPLSEKRLKKLPKIDQIAVAQKIRLLIKEEKKLLIEEKLREYKDIYRVRVGNCRVVYRKFSDSYYIILISHRKDIYEVLERILKS